MHPKTLSINTQHLVLMANVKDAPFKCLLCKKIFISENHLRRHEARRHSSKIPSKEGKDDAIAETANESTIKAVLNATERIEDLLVKLAINENEKKPDIPVASSSSRSNFDFSLVTSSSLSTDQNIETIRRLSYDDSDKKQPVVAKSKYNERKKIENFPVTSNAFNSEKRTSEQNIENRGQLSNDSSFSGNQKENPTFKINGRGDFENKGSSHSFTSQLVVQNIDNNDQDSNGSASSKNKKELAMLKFNQIRDSIYKQVPSDSFAADICEQIIENHELNSNDNNTSENRQKDIAGLKYNQIKESMYERVSSDTSAAGPCEQNIENHEHKSNDDVSEQNEIVSLKYNRMGDSTDHKVPYDSYRTKSKQNVVSCEYNSNTNIYNKNQKEMASSKYNERSDFEDTLVVSDPFISEKVEQNIENCLNDNRSDKRQKGADELNYYETSDFEDTQLSSGSFTVERCEPSIEHYDKSNDNESYGRQKDTKGLNCKERRKFNSKQITSDSITADKSDRGIESSDRISFSNIPFKKSKQITNMACSDFLEEQENKAIWRITSSIIKSSNFSLEAIEPTYCENNGRRVQNDSIAHRIDNILEERPIIKFRSSLKSEVLRKLDCKLESYGVEASQNTLTDKEMKRIGHLMKEERDCIAKDIPNYHKLRQLIKENAHRRIEETLQARHSTYVS